MNSRLSLALLAVCLTLGFVFVQVEGQEKKPKEVIPHAQKTMPGPPLSPQEAIKKMTVPPGFSVELVVSEPDIVNPVAMHIDEKGRFWITESLEYPKRAAGPGIDRVKVIEIGDDGKAKKITTVIEGLNIPSGIAVGHGGVWVANSPDILFYKVGPDGKAAGKPEVVVTGFGRDDTHELPNSLTWGPDGYLYGLNGVFNRSSVKQDGKTFDFTCALFRIHPRTKKFDIFCEGTSNPWGVTFNDNGDAFISACVIDHLWHLTQTGYYHRQGGPYPPFTWKIESIVKHKHQQAAYCGILWFDSDAYPEEYRKKLYMGNIHGNCINADELTRDGSTYFAKPRPDFLSANDAWFMPVVQKVGPDGCMYILDWYDRYHCYQDANRDPKGIDRLRGRLYRVRYKDTPRAKAIDLTKESPAQLIKRLEDPNVFIRELAQRNLCERLIGATSPAKADQDALIDAAGELAKMVRNPKAPRVARMAASSAVSMIPDWGAEDFELDDPALRSMAVRTFATHNAQGIAYWRGRAEKAEDQEKARKHAQFVYERFAKLAHQISLLANDSSPDVRLQVAIAARNLPGVDPLPLLLDVLNNCGNDKLIPHIVWQNLHPLLEERSDDFLKQVAKLDLEKSANVLNLMPRIVDRVLAVKKQDPQALVSLVTVLSGSPKSHASAANVLALLNTKVQTGELAGDKLKALEGRLLPVVKELQFHKNLPLASEATLLGAVLKDETCMQTARDMLTLSIQPDALRLKSLEVLIAAGDAAILDISRDLLKNPKAASPALRGNVLTALGKFDNPKVAGLVLDNYKVLEPELQPKAIELLTQRAAWSKELLSEIEKKRIPPSAVNVNQIRKLLATKDTAVAKRVEAIWGTIREGRNPQREKIVAQMRDVITKTPGDPNKGMLIYKKLCAQCHKLHGEGADVGPDITSNGRSDFEQLLSNVFDPSLVIGLGYRQTNVITKAGQAINGLLVEDSPQRVVLKTQGGKIETIARGNVDEVTTSPISYMPEDVERQLSPQEIADLFALLVLDRPPNDPAARKIYGTPR
jgi:putative membrane-bound dehydrogenase-like protein